MKKLFVLVLSAASAACNTAPNQNEQMVRNMFDAFNRHDWKAMTEFYSDTAEFLDPSYGIEYVEKSRSETLAKYAEMEKLFPNVHDEVVNMVVQGDRVSVEFVSTGSADGQSFRLPISSVLTIKNGMIVRDATYYNSCQE